MFGKNKELTSSQIIKLNNLLPHSLKKDIWFDNEISTRSKGIYTLANNYLDSQWISLLADKKDKDSIKLEIESLTNKILEQEASRIIIFNTEPFEARPIGMVDIGIVKKFGTASTGNRFENGIVGYAIEQSFDNIWASNNAQEDALNEVKFKLLIKAKTLYPNCNMIFKFESDFREIGSSGNVFIYLKGTACVGEKKQLLKEEQKEVALLKQTEENIEGLKVKMRIKQEEIDFLKNNLVNIPQFKSDIEKMLGE